jgi:hypothetical protein
MGNCCGGEEDNKDMTIDNKGTRRSPGTGSGNTGAYGAEEEENVDITQYCNSKVRSILNELDDFSIPAVKDNVRVIEKGVKLLDNDARFRGEWSVDHDNRHGRGTQVWHDGSIY